MADPVGDLADYISTLFPKDSFPQGVPQPEAANHKWGPNQAGQVRYIVKQLRQLPVRSLDPADRARLGQEIATLENAQEQWTHGPWRPGYAPELPARHPAAIYHLLRKESSGAATDTPPPVAEPPPVAAAAPAPAGHRIGRWRVIEKIAKGGQGEVFKVEADEDPGQYALKRFSFGKGEGREQAKERFRREVAALRELREPGLLRLIDADEKAGWMVTELYPTNLQALIAAGNYTGRALPALSALQGIVAALVPLHEKGIVHRDIKPANIFATDPRNLVLGDFGIVFFKDEKGRVTETFERVGSRDWIAPWVDVRLRPEDVRATADVYGLGRVLWAMVAGTEHLRLWYHQDPQHNIEQRYPTNADIRWVTDILNVTVVEHETACLRSAKELLARIDAAIEALQLGGTVLREGESWPCRVCGVGHYKTLWDGKPRVMTFPAPDDVDRASSPRDLYHRGIVLTLKPFVCSYCGHLMTFFYPEGEAAPGWRRKG